MKIPPLKGMGESSADYQFRRRYGAAVAHYLSDIQLVGLGGHDLHNKPVSVADIYVPLRLHFEETRADAPQADIARGLGMAAALKNYSYVAVSGPPGSGKSTVVRALSFGLGQPKPTSITARLGDLLPMPIFLRKHNKHLDQVEDWDSFLALWCEEFGKDIGIEVTPGGLESFLERGACLCMFDGVDELGEQNRTRVRDQVVGELLQRYPENLVMVTGRPNGFQTCPYDFYALRQRYDDLEESEEILSLKRSPTMGYFRRRERRRFNHSEKLFKSPFDSKVEIQVERDKGGNLFVQPFSQKDIETFATKWFELREKSRRDRKAALKVFLKALERIPTLAELQNRPVYLTLLAIVHGNTGNLPHSRAEAYREIVQAYLGQLDALRRLHEEAYGAEAVVPNWRDEDKKRILEALAFELHTRGLSPERGYPFGMDEDLHLEVSRGDLLELLRKIVTDLSKHQPQFSLDDKNEHNPAKVLAYFEARTGFLVEISHETYQFSHLSFQEYLAAYHLYRMMRSGEYLFNIDAFLNEVLWPKLQFESFHETGLLFFSICALEGIGNLDALLQRLIAFAETQAEFDGFASFWIKLLAHRDHHLSEAYKRKYGALKLWEWVDKLNNLVPCHVVIEREWQDPPCEVDFHINWLMDELAKPDGQQKVVGFLFLLQSLSWFRERLNDPKLLTWLKTQAGINPDLNAVMVLLDACELEPVFDLVRLRVPLKASLVDNVRWRWRDAGAADARSDHLRRVLTTWLSPVAVLELQSNRNRQAASTFSQFWFQIENGFSHLLTTAESFQCPPGKPLYWQKMFLHLSKTKGHATDRARAQIWQKSLAISMALEYSRTLALNPALDMELARTLTLALNLTQNIADEFGFPLILNRAVTDNIELDVGFVFELARDNRRKRGKSNHFPRFFEIAQKISKPLYLWTLMTSLWNELELSKVSFEDFANSQQELKAPKTKFPQEEGESDLLYEHFLSEYEAYIGPHGFFKQAHELEITSKCFPVSRGSLNKGLLPHIKRYNQELKRLRAKR